MIENAEPIPELPSTLDQRRAGVILHPTSLPGTYEQGDLGPDAYHFVDFLQESGLSIWQMLPVTPTHEDHSPYMGLSVDAGNPELISLETLSAWGWLSKKALKQCQAMNNKTKNLVLAYKEFLKHATDQAQQELEQFKQDNQSWLIDYAMFVVLRERFHHQGWHQWPEPYRHRDPVALADAGKKYKSGIDQVCFEQFVFFRQWTQLKQYANERHIQMMGDMPIFVAHDSAEVWQHQEYFDLNPDGSPRSVAGVPPDYFSETGQRWGNPLYLWDVMEKDNFEWWVERFRVALTLYDAIRVDHFRGFESYWQIDAGEETAINGHWVKAPGEALFKVLVKQLHELPIVVEDLGIITPEVNELREKFGWPGMKILQFAFDGDVRNPYLPHHHVRNCVVYTGTHDNDTTLSWYEDLPQDKKDFVLQYLGNPGEPMPWALIECAFRSVADWAIVPMQDLLSLGKGHRMNTPGVTQGNWRWRFQWQQVSENLASNIYNQVTQFERNV